MPSSLKTSVRRLQRKGHKEQTMISEKLKATPQDSCAPRFPSRVAVAGAIWLTFGVIWMLIGLFAIGTMIYHANSSWWKWWASLFAMGAAGRTIVAGYETYCGTTKYLTESASASIFAATMLIGTGVVLASIPAVEPEADKLVALAIATIPSLPGTILLAAGIMALHGKQKYDIWRRRRMFKS
jgi:hypothetical protein